MSRILKYTVLILMLTTGLALAAEIRLQAAGSTFVNPVMQRWVSEYQKSHPDAKIDYQSIGSGGGIKGFTDKTVDFGASDAPLSKTELTAAGGGDNIVEFPVIAGGVVMSYNLPGLQGDLKFSGPLIANIFMGKVTKWNDPQITSINPGVNLPATAITPAWRTDGSGTTFIFTNYLATQSDDFKSSIGTGKQVKFPVGTGGKGTEGVSAAVQQTVGGIGYIEEAYADLNHMQYGLMQNKAGKFVKCTPESVSAASVATATEMKGNLLVANLWNQKGDDVYPIAGFTYIFLYKDLNNVKSKEQAQEIVDFLSWASHDGQKMAPDMHYAGLSDKVQGLIADAMNGLNWHGTAIHPMK